jgi:hypothetical protein
MQEIIIKHEGIVVGAAQSAIITETRKISPVSYWGNDDRYIDTIPGPADIKIECHRIRLPRDRAASIFTEDYPSSRNQTFPFDIEIRDGETTTYLRNIWISSTGYTYTTDDYYIIESAILDAESISTEPNYEYDEVNKQLIIDHIQKYMRDSLSSFVGEPSTKTTQLRMAEQVKHQLASVLGQGYYDDIDVTCKPDPIDPTLMHFAFNMPMPYGTVGAFVFPDPIDNDQLSLADEWDEDTNPDIQLFDVGILNGVVWGEKDTGYGFIDTARDLLDAGMIDAAGVRELLNNHSFQYELPPEPFPLAIDTEPTYTLPNPIVGIPSPIGAQGPAGVPGIPDAPGPTAPTIIPEKENSSLPILMLLGAFIGGVINTYFQLNKSTSVRVATDTIEDTVEDAISELEKTV